MAHYNKDTIVQLTICFNSGKELCVTCTLEEAAKCYHAVRYGQSLWTDIKGYEIHTSAIVLMFAENSEGKMMSLFC